MNLNSSSGFCHWRFLGLLFSKMENKAHFFLSYKAYANKVNNTSQKMWS